MEYLFFTNAFISFGCFVVAIIKSMPNDNAGVVLQPWQTVVLMLIAIHCGISAYIALQK